MSMQIPTKLGITPRLRIGVVSIGANIFPPIRMRHFILRGYEVYYFGVLPSIDNPNFRIEGFEYIPIRPRVRRYGLFASFDVALQIRSWCRRLKLDMLHIIDMAFCLCAPMSAAKVTVLENNGSDVRLAPKRCWYLPHLYRFCYRYADGIIQDSPVTQQAAFALGAPRKHNEIIELGTDFELFNLGVSKGVVRARYGFLPSTKIVFSPRSFSIPYNIDVIVRSIPLVRKRYSDIIFIFCGYDLARESQLKRLAKDLGVERCAIFVGILDRVRDLPHFYADADIVVSVPASDAMPASVVDAMACGAHVIISEVPWYEHKFIKDVDLVTVPVGDHAALADAILGLLEGRPAIDRTAIFEKVKGQSDIERMGEKLERLYVKLLAKNNYSS